MKTCHENGVFGPRDVIIMLYSTLLAYGGRCEMRNDEILKLFPRLARPPVSPALSLSKGASRSHAPCSMLRLLGPTPVHLGFPLFLYQNCRFSPISQKPISRMVAWRKVLTRFSNRPGPSREAPSSSRWRTAAFAMF